jgi:hypothetical protein
MRLAGAILMGAAVLAAQTPEPGLVRGTLLECEASAGTGELSLRSASNEVFRFRFDPKTYFERERNRVESGLLRPGELVEVVADRGAGLRYARTVHVIDPPKPARTIMSAGRLRAPRVVTESLVPRGTLTYSGLVYRVNAERLVLRTRDGTDQTIQLRQDTRFLDNGEIGELRNLQPNMRVFIRAGKDLYGEVEAFQIIRGRILQPDPK